MTRINQLYESGVRHADRGIGQQSAADLDAAIASFRELGGLLPATASLRTTAESYLGFCLAARSALTGSAQDRDEAIAGLLRLTAGPDRAGSRDSCRHLLGQLLAARATSGGMTGELLAPSAAASAQQQRDDPIRRDVETALDVLATVAQSRTLSAAERAAAARLHARLAAIQALMRSWTIRNGGGLPDLEELRAARRALTPDDPYSPQLVLELGLVLGFQATRDGSPGDRARAIGLLTDALEQIGPEDPQRGHAVLRLVLLLIADLATDPGAVPVARILRLAQDALARPGLGQEEAALLHFLAGVAGGVRAQQDGTRDSDDEALAHLNRAKDLIPENHALRVALLGQLSVFLRQRSAATGVLADGDAARAYTREMLQLAERQDVFQEEHAHPAELRGVAQIAHPGVLRGAIAGDQLTAAVQRGDLAAADQAIADLDRALSELPPANSWRPQLQSLLGRAWLGRAQLSSRDDDVTRGLRFLVAAGAQGEGGPGEQDTAYQRELAGQAAFAQAALGQLTGDRRSLDDAVRRLSATSDGAAPLTGEQAMRMWMLGRALIDRYRLTGDRRDLNNGILQLERARREADLEPGPRKTAILADLAGMYRMRDDHRRHDPRRAIDSGLLALRERAEDVLLQTGAARSLTATREASLLVGRLVSWCLADGHRDLAVEALERGRALVLHATTTAADVPGLLRAAGQDELASRWQEETATTAPSPWDGSPARPGADSLALLFTPDGFVIPADIRRRALAVLRDSSAEAGRLMPPTVGELAAAARAAGSDALVYLIPPAAPRPGCALVLRANGGLDDIALPGLLDGPVTAYNEAHQAALRALEDNDAVRCWDHALARLCDWAGEAVLGPVLRHVAQWSLSGLPRLVLIPVGRLGAVPWHAARLTRAGGAPRYALQDAVFSYAASARQLAEAARRPRSDSPVLVANPTGDLPMAGLEARELQLRYYPEALFLGRPKASASGAGTPAEVLARLPGGAGPPVSLLHVGCHATVTGSLAASYLLLAGQQRLTIAEIVAQAQGRDSLAPGFLAILGACVSDLADVDQDEALTLASALLAAGASGVVGALWSARDRPTALLMVMFHHFLNNGLSGPADALRAAQLWMLDPDRRGLADLPPELADTSAGPALAEIRAWAAFTYQGT